MTDPKTIEQLKAEMITAGEAFAATERTYAAAVYRRAAYVHRPTTTAAAAYEDAYEDARAAAWDAAFKDAFKDARDAADAFYWAARAAHEAAYDDLRAANAAHQTALKIEQLKADYRAAALTAADAAFNAYEAALKTQEKTDA